MGGRSGNFGIGGGGGFPLIGGGGVSFDALPLEVCKCTNERVPHFNARLFLENKEEIGKVDASWLSVVM